MTDDSEEFEMTTSDPLFLFNLFQSDTIAAEIDWAQERFIFYPVDTDPFPNHSTHSE
jgi:hypothetical protein